MWVRVIEVWLTTTLLRSPGFHRGVGWVHKKVREARHGKDPEELGGTNIDHPSGKGLVEHFVEELKEQLRGTSRKK